VMIVLLICSQFTENLNKKRYKEKKRKERLRQEGLFHRMIFRNYD
jgi:hypothetical protein